MTPTERAAEDARQTEALAALTPDGDPTQARQQLRTFLAQSYPDPRGPAEAMPATGMSELWNHTTLTDWAAEGHRHPGRLRPLRPH